ncbi:MULTISPECIES: sensor histidine kinase [unclassified Pseudomonas]|uniref:sensor histidine kinase n=1 Tax=unclassified Pseudomonas TaxID=196821 RepID=UPI00131ACA2F|nr:MULTISPECIES: sensor histidine kinase [unclassified Pseudomonas]
MTATAPSLRRRLLKWLVLPVLLVNLGGAVVSYQFARKPAFSALDGDLTDAAILLLEQLEVDGNGRLWLPTEADYLLRHNSHDHVWLAVRSLDGQLLFGDAAMPVQEITDEMRDGHTTALRTRINDRWVFMVGRLGVVAGQPVVASVAQTLSRHTAALQRMVLTLVAVQILVALLIAAQLLWAVRRGLKPLERLERQLDSRHYDDLAPLREEGAPRELGTFVTALNGLLLRIREGARNQRAFLDDMAHQLRTPLAGISTLTQWLRQRHAGDAESAAALAQLQAATERMTRQANQLLTLARAATARLDELIGAAMPSQLSQADGHGIDLGYELEPQTVQGNAFQLRDLLDNLIDNALRYSPRGGQVTVRLRGQAGATVLEVEDDGPGIPEAECERIFERFYRLDSGIHGTGLGLAIVRDIATAHDAGIELATATGGQGLRVAIHFPPLVVPPVEAS